MFLSVQPLTHASSWASGVSSWVLGKGLEIVLLVIGTILLTRLATWLGARITGRIDANARETDALVRSEASKHRHALAQVITWATLAIIYCVAAVAIAERFGIPLASLVAPAAVAGVALGFGAQRIVQDILAGFFIITERQYGFGDLIRLSVPSIPDPAIGTVEDVTLRVTTVRTIDGEVVITPNGQITQVTNLSRDWASAIVDVPVPAGSDVNQVSDLLRLIGEEAYKEPELHRLMLHAPTVMGVQSIDMDHFQIRLVTKTLPGKQFDVARRLRARIAAGLRDEGIRLPANIDTAEPTGAD
jgi:moderate conductance mechanosensitive channel